jgi:hypothetical protein
MPGTKRAYCYGCGRDQIFEWVFVDHGFLRGHHTYWHCPACEGHPD